MVQLRGSNLMLSPVIAAGPKPPSYGEGLWSRTHDRGVRTPVGVVCWLEEGGDSSSVVLVTLDRGSKLRDSSVVDKVTDTWPACHEFEPSTTEDMSCREAMYVKSVEAQMSSCYGLWKLEEGVPHISQVPSSLAHGSKL
ncbi:hypothetical protein TNCV_1184471 [Trichonephila clavipes]|nr:hypothetical protein TNCV_1184471 [Trichonephila clavipes]